MRGSMDFWGRFAVPDQSRDTVVRVMWGIVAAAAIGLAAMVSWLAWSGISGALQIKNGASNLSAAMQTGDKAGVTEAIDEVSNGAGKLHSAAWSWPVATASEIPYLGRSIQDLQQLSNAGLSASNALDSLAPSLRADLYRNKTVNLDALGQLIAGLPAAQGDLDDAVAALAQVNGDGLAGGTISALRDQTLGAAGPLAVAAKELPPRKAAVLDALGANGPKRYLIPLQNNAQLRASGGAPLSAVVVSFDKGKIDVPFNGYINGDAYDSHIPITYSPADPLPWGEGASGLAFVNSNAHPDWRFAGDDLLRAWNASQPLKVAGVFGLDTRAIETILDVTGPVDAGEFGTLDSSNFADQVLKNAYDEFTDNKADNETRQGINDAVGRLVVDKIVSGNTKLAVSAIGALMGDAPGRHFQMFFANKELQSAIEAMGLAGEIQTSPEADTIAIYSRNRNMAKVDVYSQRQVTSQVTLQSDGGAHVRQVLDATNTAPAHDGDEGLGYQTSLSTNEWFFVLPPKATNGSLTVPQGYQAPSQHADGLGRNVLTTLGDIKPGESVQIVAEYTLPPGTFTTADGSVLYTLTLNPQPLQTDMGLDVSVTFPDGMSCRPEGGWTSSNSGGATLVGVLDEARSYRIDCLTANV